MADIQTLQDYAQFCDPLWITVGKKVRIMRI